MQKKLISLLSKHRIILQFTNETMLHYFYLCNMRSLKMALKLDNIGMTASTLCAIHCAAIPVFFTSLPILGVGFLADPWVEWAMILIALFIGFASIVTSYFRTHHRPLPLLLLIVGFVIIILGHLLTKGWIEAIVAPIGGLLIAYAHFVNYKYIGVCRAGNNMFHVKHQPHGNSLHA
jgi:hypothetical protein